MPRPSFLDEIETRSGVTVSVCYQCCRCTNGCPVAEHMDIVPHRVIGYILSGEREKVVASASPWTCLQCATCSLRCPNGIDVARVFETLRQISAASGLAAKNDVRHFDDLIIDSVERHGRLAEMETIMRYRLSKRQFLKDAAMGLDMLKKGRIGLSSHDIRGRKQLGTIIRRMRGHGDR
ncbi:MAG: sn-glycerol-3-phosphate dehydrogenase subunit C [Syntrophorhabdus sp. PtaB.Bin047]|nr:MAG: sn-glycerol-3-phosphate dehydrogenase subunit C [Syntrophorhabdus sp. PtaB.Bin047]